MEAIDAQVNRRSRRAWRSGSRFRAHWLVEEHWRRLHQALRRGRPEKAVFSACDPPGGHEPMVIMLERAFRPITRL